MPMIGKHFVGALFFNLTDGAMLICDEVGVEAASIETAMGYAFEAIEELRAEDASSGEESRGWRLEIVDASGRMLQSIPLDTSTLQ
jgi:hypothetical protein